MADSIKVGNVEIMAVLDMIPPPRDPSVMFPETTEADWSSHQDALENGKLQLYYGVWVVRSQGQTILVDTGMGPGPHEHLGGVEGQMFDRLRDVLIPADRMNNTNVGPSDEVNIVVHTHLHGDHVGWNIDYTNSQPAPTFPKARYLVPRLDWEHFTQHDVIETAPQVTNSVIPLLGMGLMDLVDSEYNITDEVKTLSTPGHTPGHMVIVITSQGEKAMVVGDLLHNKAQVERPDWTAGVDTDKEASRLNRESILDQAEQEGYVIAAGHFHPNDHIGKVMRLEGKRFWHIL